jgi:hypothetical protein
VRRAFSLLLAAAACSAPEEEHAPTWSEDVAPIVDRSCGSCHTAGGIAPFELTSYEAAKAYAVPMANATKSRLMPPANVDASGACNSYTNARWLEDDQIAAIDRWVQEGMIEGPPRASEGPAAEGGQALEGATTVDPRGEYTPRESLSDDYRCFIVDPEISEDLFLSAYEVVPGSARTVHHVILFTIDTEGAEALADALDAAEEGPGYTCFGGSLLGLQDSRAIAAWAPGTSVTRFPEESGIRIRGGRRMVMQVHYNTKNGVEPDRTLVRLELQKGVDRPAEILGVADLGLAIPPRLERFTTEPVRVSPGVGGFIRGVFPHMHRLGVSLSAQIVHADGTTTCLTETPRWDFSWQELYFFKRPIYVSSTDRVEIRCAYDTSSRSEEVHWGEGTDDEMCLLALYVTLN